MNTNFPQAIFMVEESYKVLSSDWRALISLSPRERHRESSFKNDQSRNDFIAAHILGRIAASMVCSKPPSGLTIQQFCPTCQGPHGRPQIPEVPALTLSLSHSMGVVAAAVSYEDIGIDVERFRTRVFEENVCETICSPAEKRLLQGINEFNVAEDKQSLLLAKDITFLRFWTRKEAMIKAGRLTLDSMASMDSSPYPIEVNWRENFLTHHRHDDWLLTDFTDANCLATGSIYSRTLPVRAEFFTPS